MDSELPLVGRHAEVAVVYGLIERVAEGSGGAVLLIGEAGIGKSRLLAEARKEADRRNLVVLKGRAVESGGAYRPLVEAFARSAAPFADDARLAGVRPVLAASAARWLSSPGAGADG